MFLFAVAARILSSLLGILEVLMLVRAILSWIPPTGGKWVDLLYMVTEPVVAPIRALLDRWGFFRHSPIDFSFVFAFLLIGLLRSWLSALAVAFL